MHAITAAVPVYDGLLALATHDEAETIRRSGLRHRPRTPILEAEEDKANAREGYRAIRAILSRLAGDNRLCITGIDSRSMPPRREIVETEVVLTGRLSWSKRPGVESILELRWAGPTVTIVNLRIEPRIEHTADTPVKMRPSAHLTGNERIDDTHRLRRMQEVIDEGNTPTKASLRVAAEMPRPGTTDESLAKTLRRKFKKRLGE